MTVVLTFITVMEASGDEFCKWTDENGVVHYAEKCPDDVTPVVVTAEDKRSESQIRAAEERSKSLLSKPTPSTKSSKRSQRSKSEIRDNVTAHPRPQDSRDMSQMSVEELDALCEKEREKRLAPEREQLIQNCVTNRRSSQEYCERYYSDYGAPQRIDEQYVRPALYMDLPECVAAWEARRQQN